MAKKICKTCKHWDNGECSGIEWRLNGDTYEDYENIAHVDVNVSDDYGLDVKILTPVSFGCNNWED